MTSAQCCEAPTGSVKTFHHNERRVEDPSLSSWGYRPASPALDVTSAWKDWNAAEVTSFGQLFWRAKSAV